MINVKLNADLGEGANIEKLIMPFLSSCSIACGGHTGDVNSMSEAVKIAVEHNVKIGAHPSTQIKMVLEEYQLIYQIKIYQNL